MSSQTTSKEEQKLLRLIEKGNINKFGTCLKKVNNARSTYPYLIVKAINCKQFRIAKEMIIQGWDINTRKWKEENFENNTLLHVACRESNWEVCLFLLLSEADSQIRNVKNQKPISLLKIEDRLFDEDLYPFYMHHIFIDHETLPFFEFFKMYNSIERNGYKVSDEILKEISDRTQIKEEKHVMTRRFLRTRSHRFIHTEFVKVKTKYFDSVSTLGKAIKNIEKINKMKKHVQELSKMRNLYDSARKLLASQAPKMKTSQPSSLEEGNSPSTSSSSSTSGKLNIRTFYSLHSSPGSTTSSKSSQPSSTNMGSSVSGTGTQSGYSSSNKTTKSKSKGSSTSAGSSSQGGSRGGGPPRKRNLSEREFDRFTQIFGDRILEIDSILSSQKLNTKENMKILELLKLKRDNLLKEQKLFGKIQDFIEIYKTFLQQTELVHTGVLEDPSSQTRDWALGLIEKSIFRSLEHQFQKSVKSIRETQFYKLHLRQLSHFLTETLALLKKPSSTLKNEEEETEGEEEESKKKKKKKKKEQGKKNNLHFKDFLDRVISLVFEYKKMINNEKLKIQIAKQITDTLWEKSKKGEIEENSYKEEIVNYLNSFFESKEALEKIFGDSNKEESKKLENALILFSKIFIYAPKSEDEEALEDEEEKLVRRICGFDYVSMKRLYQKIKNVTRKDLESKFLLCLRLHTLNHGLEEIIESKDKNKLYTEGRSIFDVMKDLKSNILGKYQLFFFDESVSRIYQNYPVFDFKIYVEEDVRRELTVIKEYLKKVKELNEVAKIHFRDEIKHIDNHDTEKELELLIELIVPKFDQLWKMVERMDFNFPEKVFIRENLEQTYYGKEFYSGKKKGGLLSRTKTHMTYFGEMVGRINSRTRTIEKIRNGVGKEFTSDKKLFFYGKFKNNERHGMGCSWEGSIVDHPSSGEGSLLDYGVEGEWRKGMLFRRDINKIKLHEIRVDKLIKKMDFRTARIGSGGFGEVYKISYQGKLIAVKIFSKNTGKEEFLQECKIIASLHHPHIVSFLGYWSSPLSVCTEYCPHGSISKLISDVRKKRVSKRSLSRKRMLEIIKETATGIDYLHKCHLMHRDLKWENVLIGEDKKVRIIDFGLSKTVQSYRISVQHTQKLGTSFYMAPEIVRGKGDYSFKCDVYSFGIMIYELIFLTMNPFESRLGKGKLYVPVEILVSENPDFRPKIEWNKLSRNMHWVVHLMTQCWDHDPSKRPTFEQISKQLSTKVHMIRINQEIGQLGIGKRVVSSPGSPQKQKEKVTKRVGGKFDAFDNW